MRFPPTLRLQLFPRRKNELGRLYASAMSDFVVYFTLSVLAVYRVSYMIANEDGPLDVFVFIREKVSQKNWIGRGLNCVLCISVWLSIIPAVAMVRNIGFFRSSF